jgi:3-methyladenine DNA glycosylase AlkC
MFHPMGKQHEEKLRELLQRMSTAYDMRDLAQRFHHLVEEIRKGIPEKKRISYGRYSIIRELGESLYPMMAHMDIPAFCNELFHCHDADPFVRSMAVEIYSIMGVEIGDLEPVLQLFEEAAGDKQWEVRECSAGFIRKVVKAYPESLHDWYLKMVTHSDNMKRRFASESLRPVAENRYFKKNPEFPFSIIEHLFHESHPYPRTSAGNSLSDWMRVDGEYTLAVIKKLASNGDSNSHWIAYRACRNIVKKEPIMVMDMLGVDEYRYKDRNYYRKDYQ